MDVGECFGVLAAHGYESEGRLLARVFNRSIWNRRAVRHSLPVAYLESWV
jgi:hypothetical protein